MKFHHVGYACQDLDTETHFLSQLGYSQESEDFIDPIQGIKGRFLYSPTSPRIELLVQLENSNVLDAWLSKGVKMYHLAYLVTDMMQAIDTLKQQRAKLIVRPTVSVAFSRGGVGKICFLLLPNLLLIELIEIEVL